MDRFHGERSEYLNKFLDRLWDMRGRIQHSNQLKGYPLNLYLGSEEYYDLRTMDGCHCDEVQAQLKQPDEFLIFGIPFTVIHVNRRNHFNFARQE